ncbi:MAG: hypothetical protein OXK17_06460 [Thaumarchaeota archaeon]|nr:hypothetical protein [Nitrososphaerota archaeon]
MKVRVGFTLSPENVENMRKAADKDDRSTSKWLDRKLTEHFDKNPP